MNAPLPEPDNHQSARLPGGVIPRHYRIEMAPDLDEGSFGGVVEIDVEITEAVPAIVCNAAELTIHRALLTRGGHQSNSGAVGDNSAKATPEDEQQASTIRLDATLHEQDERLVLTAGSEVFEPGPARLRIEFDGVLNDRLCGFYRSSFTDDDGTSHTIAVTQFEATDARRAFPCWDEPALKATFEISLVIDDGLLAVSNCAEVGREPAGVGHPHNKVRVSFATTMVMSTYLVAFVVGPLEATEPVDVNGVPVRVIHRPGRGHQTAFALETAAHGLVWLADYYGMDYPSDKVDLVAIPDFAFGAMENLGCVTFREVSAVDRPGNRQPGRAATRGRRDQPRTGPHVVRRSCDHGLVGGDLAQRGVRHVHGDLLHPRLQARLAGVVDVRARLRARLRGGCLGHHPSHRTRGDHPRGRRGHVRRAHLRKGRRCAAHARAVPGPRNVPRRGAGVSAHPRLRQHFHLGLVGRVGAGVATAGACGDGTLDPPGRPSAGECHAHSPRGAHHPAALHLEPRPGRSAHLVGACASAHPCWRHRNRNPCDRGQRRSHPHASSRRGGHRQRCRTGFYRTAPEPETLARIARNGAHAWSRWPDERRGVVDDAWALVVSGRLGVAQFLDFAAGGFRAERDLNVWQSLGVALNHLHRLVAPADAPALNALILAATSAAAEELTLTPQPGESDRTRELRGVLIRLRGATAAHPQLVSECRGLLDHHEPAVAAAALAVTAAHGGAAEFRVVRERYETAVDTQSEQRHLAALADFGDPVLVGSILESTLDGGVRTQDGPYLVRRALANPEPSVGEAVWGFVTGRWEEIDRHFPSNSISRMLAGITALDRPELAQQVAAFLADHPVPQGAKQIAQHLERLEVNTALRRRATGALAEALSGELR